MTQDEKDILLKDLCARLPYGVEVEYNSIKCEVLSIDKYNEELTIRICPGYCPVVKLEDVKPFLFPFSSMTDEDHTIYFKIWEDTGKMAYLEGCHHLICNIKAYKIANDYLLNKHYDINGLIPKGLANDATGLNIY